MRRVEELKEKIMSGGLLTREEAVELAGEPLEELAAAADEIRARFCGNGFDLCTIVNAKCGRCPEDCRYCAQSAHYDTGDVDVYGLLPSDRLVADARYNHEKGVLRYSMVTSGRRLSKEEVERAAESIRRIKADSGISVCVSFGLLDEEDFRKLKAAGASRVHCNLETSEKYFPQICTTHRYEEKLETIRAAERAGLSVCSGGIMGLGESMEDRIDMVTTIRELGVKSVPVNFLNPIKGTPLEDNVPLNDEEALRCVSVFRFLIPDASIRLAGGRGLMDDKGVSCFRGGANAAITGDMLTTSGITVETDRRILEDLGYEVRLYEG